MPRVEFEYAPQGPVVEQYLADRSQRAFICGPLGSSKTNASCWKAFRVMCDQRPDKNRIRKTRIAAVRNTYPDLMGTTAKDWLEMFGDLGDLVRSSLEPPHQNLDFDLGDGTRVKSEMVFLALDREEHVKKLRGMQLTALMLSEVKELPFAVVQMADLRIGRYPNEVAPSWYGIFGDTNAPDTDHWYYKLAEETKPDGWSFYKQPGGLIRDSKSAPWRLNRKAENLRNLPPNYYLKGAQGKDEDWILVNLANEYGFVKSGKPVYPDYRDSLHCREFELVKELGLYVGLDFGLTPAALFGQRSLSGQWMFRHELCTQDTGIIRFAGELKRFMQQHYPDWRINAITGDPAGDQRQAGDTEERTVFQLLEAQGIDALPAHSNDFTLRSEAFGAQMRQLIDGEPAMLIHPDCKITRKGLQGGYAYKRVKVSGDERWRDMPDKNIYSHPCFVAGTVIDTPSGPAAIELLQVGNLVSTPLGPRPIRFTMNRPAEVFTLTTSAGVVTCTPDHPFYTTSGFVPAEALQYRQLIAGRGPLWKILFKWRRIALARSGRSTSSQDTGSTGAAGTTKPTLASICTGQYGSPRTGPRQPGFTFTTRTRTPDTTGSQTSNVFRLLTTGRCTWQMLTEHLRRAVLSAMPSLPRLIGVSEIQSAPERSVHEHCSKSWPSEARTVSYAAIAQSHTPAMQTSLGAGSAAHRVKGWRERHRALTTLIARVLSVLLSFVRTSTSAVLPARALAAGNLRQAVVYNIEVEEAHAYYANGFLVSNCEAGQYLVMGAGDGHEIMGAAVQDSAWAAYNRKMHPAQRQAA